MLVAAFRGMLFGCALSFAATSLSSAAGPLPGLEVLRATAGVEGFAQVLEPRTFNFPDDHGPHPDYRQEWWYVTGNLDASTGERFGFELTFFRFALAPAPPARVPRTSQRIGAAAGASIAAATDPMGATADSPPVEAVTEEAESAWRTRQIYIAHFAITDVARGRFRYAEKLSRGAVGLAGAQVPPLRVWIDDWSLAAVPDPAVMARTQGLPGDRVHWTVRAAAEGYELALDAQALLAPVLNGDRGFSRKSNDPGSASYYYSIPRVAVRGRLAREGKAVEVHGLAWVDREWSSEGLGDDEQGWDWFALQMGDGTALMFYALRDRNGQWDPNSAGTWVAADGRSRALSAGQVRIDVTDHWINPRGARYPSRWRVRVPTVGLDVDVRPVLADQELATSPRYWEGAVDVIGASNGLKMDGRGYVELVGYSVQ
jgi:predicted secreted hydrolase